MVVSGTLFRRVPASRVSQELATSSAHNSSLQIPVLFRAQKTLGHLGHTGRGRRSGASFDGTNDNPPWYRDDLGRDAYVAPWTLGTSWSGRTDARHGRIDTGHVAAE